jgi:hypothetical protein
MGSGTVDKCVACDASCPDGKALLIGLGRSEGWALALMSSLAASSNCEGKCPKTACTAFCHVRAHTRCVMPLIAAI